MTAKRIIPCLDIKEGRVVKGVNFVGIKDVGDPVECARLYVEQGADEIAFLDITATYENRGTIVDLVRKTAKVVSVPLTVGGGMFDIEGIQAVLEAGADKVSINTAAVKNPELIKAAADKFGSERIIVAIDAKAAEDGFTVVINGGRVDAGIGAIDWAKRAESLGAGEILLTSMDADGTKAGFDIGLTKAVAEAVAIPVTASGGCGKLEDFSEVFQKTKAAAALAASLFHYRELTVGEVKRHLTENGIPVLAGIDELFAKSELIPAIIQDSAKEVLMLAYMNRESLNKTLETGYTWFYSRSRQRLWNKGETSGHVQRVKEIMADCDGDTLLITVEQTGPACHTGNRSCFYRGLPWKRR